MSNLDQIIYNEGILTFLPNRTYRCECRSQPIRRTNIQRHIQTATHRRYMETPPSQRNPVLTNNEVIERNVDNQIFTIVHPHGGGQPKILCQCSGLTFSLSHAKLHLLSYTHRRYLENNDLPNVIRPAFQRRNIHFDFDSWNQISRRPPPIDVPMPDVPENEEVVQSPPVRRLFSSVARRLSTPQLYHVSMEDCLDRLLMYTIVLGDLDLVQVLVNDYGAVLDKTITLDNERASPLFVSCKCNHTCISLYLISKDVNVETGNCMNITPLMEAASHGNLEVVKALCDAGASCQKTDNINRRPHKMALDKGHMDVVLFLEPFEPGRVDIKEVAEKCNICYEETPTEFWKCNNCTQSHCMKCREKIAKCPFCRINM